MYWHSQGTQKKYVNWWISYVHKVVLMSSQWILEHFHYSERKQKESLSHHSPISLVLISSRKLLIIFVFVYLPAWDIFNKWSHSTMGLCISLLTYKCLGSFHIVVDVIFYCWIILLSLPCFCVMYQLLDLDFFFFYLLAILNHLWVNMCA